MEAAIQSDRRQKNMAKGNLGFGWMRLPLKSGDTGDIDHELVKKMKEAEKFLTETMFFKYDV